MDTKALESSLKRSKGKKTALYLDDVRIPTEIPEGYEWFIVRSYDEFVRFITAYYRKYRELPALISLDHDLTPEYIHFYFEHPGERIVDYGQFKTKSGYHCLVWLIMTCDHNEVSFADTLFAIHSHNELGIKNMKDYLSIAKSSRYGVGKDNTFIKNWNFVYSKKEEQRLQKEYEDGDKEGIKNISQEKEGWTTLDPPNT